MRSVPARRASFAAIAAIVTTSMIGAYALWPSATAARSSDPGLARLAACQACHGSDGIAIVDGVPNLAGQSVPYLEAQLKNFRSGDRKNDLMNAIASQLSDAEIAALAGHWNATPHAGALDARGRGTRAVASDVTFPSTFPNDFEVYLTNADPAAKIVVRDWANRAALEAARAGKPLPEDAVIVVETSSGRLEGEGLVADAPLSYAVFAARAGWGEHIPELLRNGNWQFGAFAPDGKPQLQNQAACLACHKPQAAQSFMFTYDRLAAHAKKRRS
ncbi:MAG: cytochrome P460 family protein [Xanthomonadaceae bacterium]|nr:cytochrome P460 family protein [Xanthomonadaceae bacterium]